MVKRSSSVSSVFEPVMICCTVIIIVTISLATLHLSSSDCCLHSLVVGLRFGGCCCVGLRPPCISGNLMSGRKVAFCATASPSSNSTLCSWMDAAHSSAHYEQPRWRCPPPHQAHLWGHLQWNFVWPMFVTLNT
jgi:hypothetical protein